MYRHYSRRGACCCCDRHHHRTNHLESSDVSNLIFNYSYAEIIQCWMLSSDEAGTCQLLYLCSLWNTRFPSYCCHTWVDSIQGNLVSTQQLSTNYQSFQAIVYTNVEVTILLIFFGESIGVNLFLPPSLWPRSFLGEGYPWTAPGGYPPFPHQIGVPPTINQDRGTHQPGYLS